jgi:hypothetical protein
MDETFAVVQSDDSPIDFTQVARVIADPLDLVVAELVPVLPQRSGIFVENLPEGLAKLIAAALLHAGINAKVVTQSAIVELPEVVTLRSGRPDDEVFFWLAQERKGVVKWPGVVWVDLVSVQEASTEEFEDWHVVNSQRLVTKTPWFVDIVIYEPWLLLRIPQEGFEFTATGLPVFPTRRDNLTALSATIATKAKEASLGPGLSWIETRSTPREHRASSQAVYRGFLRWQLTRAFLDEDS